MNEITIEAQPDNFLQVQEFIGKRLDDMGCKMKERLQIDVAVEEIFVNIAHYAYKPDTGTATVIFEENEDSVTITFIDSGKAYNPLKKNDPDITLSAEERQIGGLGIFLVKKSMDDMKYEYKEGKNILSITKKIK